MGYKKPAPAAAKKPWNGNKGGGFQKKEFDPTIVSAKDIGIARANAVTAVHTLAAAHIAAGSELPFDIDEEVERIFNESVEKFDHPRIGSATKVASAKAEKSVSAAEKAVKEGLGEDEDDDDEPAASSDTDDDETPYANLEIKGGKHAGNTLQDIYDEEPDYVEWLATVKNKNEYTRKAAKAFLKAVA